MSDMSNTSLVLKAGKYFVDFLDGIITAREEKARAEGDNIYGELLAELNKLNGEDAPAPIREILPRLFARDLSFWLKAHDTNLIIFLDAYEKLKGEEQGKKNIRAAANVYLKKFFDENKLSRRYDSDSRQNYYFGMWSEIIRGGKSQATFQ